MKNLKPTTVRFSEKDQALIARAAAISGLKKSEFVVHSAREAATNTILDERALVAEEDKFNEIEDYLNENKKNEQLERTLDKARVNPLW